MSGTAPAPTLRVVHGYDAEGNRLTTVRTSILDGVPVGSVTAAWAYDAAHRTLMAAATGVQGFTYDANGNVSTISTARSHTITMEYDALDRLTRRITPGVVRVAEEAPYEYQLGLEQPSGLQRAWFPYYGDSGFVSDPGGTPPPVPPSLRIPADTATFTYDVTGMRGALNRDAAIHRSYFANGALLADTLVLAPVDTGASTHAYALHYTYDFSGRRLSRSDSVAGSGCPPCTQTYTYDPALGVLRQTTDATHAFTFAYDGSLRLRATSVDAAALVRAFTYDADSRLTARTVTGRGTTAEVYSDAMTYDQAGRVTTSSNGSAATYLRDDSQHEYGGLGALIATRRTRDNQRLTDVYTVDPMGNVLAQRRYLDDMPVGAADTTAFFGEQLVSRGSIPPPLDPELAGAEQGIDSTLNRADGAGNVELALTVHYRRTEADTIWRYAYRTTQWVWQAYGADEQLRVTQRSWREPAGVNTAVLRTAFTDYRYDALGRRVLTRTRMDQFCTPDPALDKCRSTVERTIWDGDQILVELKADVPPAATGEDVEVTATGGAFAGAVRYTHAGGIDEPLALWKVGYGGLVPHRSWREMYEAVSNIDGTFNTADRHPPDGARRPGLRRSRRRAWDAPGPRGQGQEGPAGPDR